MSFIDFLSQNYVWIIIIVVLGIITIIGFVADSGSRKKKNKLEYNNNNNQNSYGQPNMNNNINMPNVNAEKQMPVGNQNFNSQSNISNISQSNIPQYNNVTETGNHLSESNREISAGHTAFNSALMNNDIPTNKPNSMGYVPLSEQKPNFIPKVETDTINNMIPNISSNASLEQQQTNSSMNIEPISVMPQPIQPIMGNDQTMNISNQNANSNSSNISSLGQYNQLNQQQNQTSQPVANINQTPTNNMGMNANNVPNYNPNNNNIPNYNINNNVPNYNINNNVPNYNINNNVPNYNINNNIPNYNINNNNNVPYGHNPDNKF
jgi:hypothetical protein